MTIVSQVKIMVYALSSVSTDSSENIDDPFYRLDVLSGHFAPSEQILRMDYCTHTVPCRFCLKREAKV